MPDVLPLRLCARERQCGVILCVFSKFKIRGRVLKSEFNALRCLAAISALQKIHLKNTFLSVL
jgi:hypothetical protein